MSAEDCPFQIIKPDISEDDSFHSDVIKFEMLIGANDQGEGGTKTTLTFPKLLSSDPEDVLYHYRTFDKLLSDLRIEDDDTESMFGTFALCLGPNASLEWNDVLAEYEERDEDTFVQAKEQYLLTKIH